MGHPIKPKKRTIEAMKSEIRSAISSLHMEPMPIPNPDAEARFLSETDYWAEHSIDHMHNAIRNCAPTRRDLSKLLHRYFRVLQRKLNDPDYTNHAKTQWIEVIFDQIIRHIIGY